MECGAERDECGAECWTFVRLPLDKRCTDIHC